MSKVKDLKVISDFLIVTTCHAFPRYYSLKWP